MITFVQGHRYTGPQPYSIYKLQHHDNLVWLGPHGRATNPKPGASKGGRPEQT